MERKRKLPARAAARGESAAKKRNVTPREDSATPAPPPAPAPAPAPEPEEPPPPPLPKSIQAGKPLPTVEVAQPEDLSSKEYQTVGERYVMLNRSYVTDTKLTRLKRRTGRVALTIPSKMDQ
jgi:hypothetical protein